MAYNLFIVLDAISFILLIFRANKHLTTMPLFRPRKGSKVRIRNGTHRDQKATVVEVLHRQYRVRVHSLNTVVRVAKDNCSQLESVPVTASKMAHTLFVGMEVVGAGGIYNHRRGIIVGVSPKTVLVMLHGPHKNPVRLSKKNCTPYPPRSSSLSGLHAYVWSS